MECNMDRDAELQDKLTVRNLIHIKQLLNLAYEVHDITYLCTKSSLNGNISNLPKRQERRIK